MCVIAALVKGRERFAKGLNTPRLDVCDIVFMFASYTRIHTTVEEHLLKSFSEIGMGLSKL